MIHYVTGDATQPIETPAVIAHVCNDVGAWGAGFVLALSARWPEPEQHYRDMHEEGFAVLGRVNIVKTSDPDIVVANMVAQAGVRGPKRKLRYTKLRWCLEDVGLYASQRGLTVHMPRIGCGLGGGQWHRVEEIIEDTLVHAHGLDVYVYDLPEGGK